MEILGKKLLIILSHPDDESFLTAGLIFGNHKAQGHTTLVCATLGEKGKYHTNKPVTSRQLKQIRKLELIRVSKFLKVSNLKILNFPDGDLNSYQLKLLSTVAKIAKVTRPDIIVSFGPDGITGHRDHIAAYLVAAKLAKKFKLPFIATSLPPRVLTHAARWLAPKRKNDHYVNHVRYRQPNIKIPSDPKRKLKALMMHKSQVGVGGPLYNFPPSAAREILRADYFVSLS